MGLASDTSWWTKVLEYSQRVGQVLGRQDDVRVPRGTPTNDEDLWIAIRRIVWELLEIFYVNQPLSLSAQVQDFAAWLQRNSQILTGFDSGVVPIEAMLKGLYECNIPEMEDRYWTCIQLLVMLGFNEAAIDLLSMHSAWTRYQNKDTAVRAQFEILESLITILQKSPRLAGSSVAPLGAKVFNNVTDYSLYRSKWSLACRQLLQNDMLWQECSQSNEMTTSGAKSILNILLGQENTLKDCTRTWIELLCSQLLHRYPTIDSLSELSSLAEYCIDQSSENLKVIVDILQAILNDNVQEVISQCSQTLGPWFMAHAPDLLDARQELHLTEVLRKPIKGRQGNQFEFFVLDFAEALMTNTSTWQTVCEYLAWCPTCGESALQIFLSHLPINTQEDKIVLQALEIANRHGLPACAAQLCRTLGLSRWQQGQLGSAVLWLKRGHDDRRLKYLGQQVFKQVEGSLLNDTAAGGVQPQLEMGYLKDMLLFTDEFGGENSAENGNGGPLAMLQHLQLFHAKISKSLNAKSTEEAYKHGMEAKDAVLHLVGNQTPKKLWLAVLWFAIPLLESEQLLFNLEETTSLLERLHELTLSYNSEEILAEYLPNERNLKLQGTQLALARNMARAILVEQDAK
jgi:nuclear pore complex protein Nup85